MRIDIGFNPKERRGPASALNATSIIVYDDMKNPIAIIMQRSDGSIFMQNASEPGFDYLLRSFDIAVPSVQRFSAADGQHIIRV